MRHLVEDPNTRVRLIAASCLLSVDPGDAKAGAVLVEALGDPAPRVRKGALELVETLGPAGAVFVKTLKQCVGLEGEPEMRAAFARLVERLASPVRNGKGPGDQTSLQAPRTEAQPATPKRGKELAT
jgi:hypothetical protein